MENVLALRLSGRLQRLMDLEADCWQAKIFSIPAEKIVTNHVGADSSLWNVMGM